MKTENKEKIDLNGFTGTENYYRASLFGELKVTDGVQYLRTEGNCYWLTDIIFSYQPKLKQQDFQVWKLNKYGTKGWMVSCEDGDYNILISQFLEYSDFEEQTGLTEVTIWVENDVAMLPSER